MKNNNIVRRLKCLCLTLLLLFSIIFATPVSATGVAEINFGEVTAKIGTEVIVPVTIKNNPGIAAFRFRVSYNTDDLEFVSVEKGSVLTNGTMSSVTDAEEKTMTFTWLSVNDNLGDGEIALLKFNVLAHARGNYSLTVTYLPEDLLNEDLGQISYAVTNGKISTGSTISGRITSFGESYAPITLRLLENGVEIDKITTIDGTYLFETVSSGTYTIEVTKKGHAKLVATVTVAKTDILQNLKLTLMGDIDGVEGVSDRDAVYLLYHTFLPGSYPVNQNCDYNNDGEVNDKDAIYLLYHTFLPESYPIG